MIGGYDGACADIAAAVGKLGLWGASRKQRDYELLYALAKKYGGPVLEQGTSYGLSTRYLARGTPDTVFTVDTRGPDFSKHDIPPVPETIRAVKADSTTWAPPVPCIVGFEDAAHTFDCTFNNLQRQHDAGCQAILVHDTAEWNQYKKGGSQYACRKAALYFFSFLPSYDLWDVDSDSGMILALRKDTNLAGWRKEENCDHTGSKLILENFDPGVKTTKCFDCLKVLDDRPGT